MLAVPFALKMFFGVETMFTKHLAGMFNATFFAASFAATYLCLDPIRKAVNVLRCFHGSSLQSGADLAVQLRTVRRASLHGAGAVVAVVLGVTVLGAAPVSAAMKEEPKVRSAELSRSLDDVLERREFAWRSPRDRQPGGQSGRRLVRPGTERLRTVDGAVALPVSAIGPVE